MLVYEVGLKKYVFSANDTVHTDKVLSPFIFACVRAWQCIILYNGKNYWIVICASLEWRNSYLVFLRFGISSQLQPKTKMITGRLSLLQWATCIVWVCTRSCKIKSSCGFPTLGSSRKLWVCTYVLGLTSSLSFQRKARMSLSLWYMSFCIR